MNLFSSKQRWLVTGAAGFIGSHLVDRLLSHGQEVVGLDNLSTGKLENLKEARKSSDFHLLHGDIRSFDDCTKAVDGVQGIFHQGALASVPMSIRDPLATHEVNVTGTVNIFKAAVDAQVKRVVYASSSSVYGDCPRVPIVEEEILSPLSPYALSKMAMEQYAKVFERCYGLETVGLRYFNVFGPRQDPSSPYSGVISIWSDALQKGKPAKIYGDGTSTRDYCFVSDVIEANLLAMNFENKTVIGKSYNVGTGMATSLLTLWKTLVAIQDGKSAVENLPYRSGDILHSTANTAYAEKELRFKAKESLAEGLKSLIAE
jgi:UDP-N-acetylglucosamine 4-epimerase